MCSQDSAAQSRLELKALQSLDVMLCGHLQIHGRALRLPHVGGGGSFVARSTGCSFNILIASATARSSCGSCPAITSLGQFSTSMSGAVPSFSTAHLLSRVKNPPRGAIIDPPSMKGGVSAVRTSPPHVRLPTSGPSLRKRNMYGIKSPPEPAISLMIITFGPQMPADGLVNGYRSPATLLKYPSKSRCSTSMM